MLVNNGVNSAVGLPYLGTLPEMAKARGGSFFRPPSDDLWELREGTHELTLHFYELPEVEPGFKTAFKAALLWYVQNHSTRHLGNMFYRAKDLFQFKQGETRELVAEITDIDLLNYRSAIGEHREWYLSSLSVFSSDGPGSVWLASPKAPLLFSTNFD